MKAVHYISDEGIPCGGNSQGEGFLITWQNSTDEGKNGAAVEEIIAAAVDRLEFYQTTSSACEENDEMLRHLKHALERKNGPKDTGKDKTPE